MWTAPLLAKRVSGAMATYHVRSSSGDGRPCSAAERVVGQRLSLVHSLDYLVCSNQERRRDGKPESPGCLEVDDQLELGGLFNGQVASSGAFEDPVDVGGCA